MYVHVRDILYMSSVFTVFLVFSFFILFLKHFGYLFVYLDFHMCYRERKTENKKCVNTHQHSKQAVAIVTGQCFTSNIPSTLTITIATVTMAKAIHKYSRHLFI